MSRRRDRHIIIRIFNGLSAYEWEGIISEDLVLSCTRYNFFNGTWYFSLSICVFVYESDVNLIFLYVWQFISPQTGNDLHFFWSFLFAVAHRLHCQLISTHMLQRADTHTKSSNDINSSIIDCNLSVRICFLFCNERKRGLFFKRSWLQSLSNLFKTYYPGPRIVAKFNFVI